MNDIAIIFKALADETRLRVLKLLAAANCASARSPPPWTWSSRACPSTCAS